MLFRHDVAGFIPRLPPLASSPSARSVSFSRRAAEAALIFFAHARRRQRASRHFTGLHGRHRRPLAAPGRFLFRPRDGRQQARLHFQLTGAATNRLSGPFRSAQAALAARGFLGAEPRAPRLLRAACASASHARCRRRASRPLRGGTSRAARCSFPYAVVAQMLASASFLPLKRRRLFSIFRPARHIAGLQALRDAAHARAGAHQGISGRSVSPFLTARATITAAPPLRVTTPMA